MKEREEGREEERKRKTGQRKGGSEERGRKETEIINYLEMKENKSTAY